MQDQELLELSAKAVGISGSYYKGVLNDEWVNGIIFIRYDGQQCVWNPLDDNADAFRLAVELNLFNTFFMDTPVWLLKFNASDPDRFRATRCGITHAAAEIGKPM